MAPLHARWQNNLLFSANTTLGNAVNNGTLCVGGSVNLGAATSQPRLSPVRLSSPTRLPPAVFNKLGTDTLTLKGTGNNFNQAVVVASGTLVFDGSTGGTTTVRNTGFRPDASTRLLLRGWS